MLRPRLVVACLRLGIGGTVLSRQVLRTLSGLCCRMCWCLCLLIGCCCHLRYFCCAFVVRNCFRCCCLHLDGPPVDAFEENAGWYGRPGRTDVRELVSFYVVVPGDVVEFTTVEISFEFVVELLVGRHVVGYCVAVSHRLLDDEVGVPVNYEASGSACFGHAHAM